MKKKLLNKTLGVYLLFSAGAILLTAPLFYIFTDHLFTHEANEELFLLKDDFAKSAATMTEAGIATWNAVNRDVRIESELRVTKDSLFNELFFNHLADEEVPYRVLLSPVHIQQKQYTLKARVSLIESDVLIRNIALLYFIILLLLLTGLYWITRLLSRRLWRPFYATIDHLERFELDQGTPPALAGTTIEEFDRLNKSVEKLLEKNILIYKSQKEFIENAAHELQTPIASFLAKLDVLVQEIPVTKPMGEALSSLHESAARIIRLNKNLLLLSKMENDQYGLSESVSVEKVLEKQSGFLKEQLAEKDITFRLEETSPLTISANLTLVEVAAGNLLLNALKHNTQGGRIIVTLKDRQLTILNSGASVLPNLDTLFSRFSNSGTGSGLGLAIVKKICDLHGWKLQYSFIENFHRFIILF